VSGEGQSGRPEGESVPLCRICGEETTEYGTYPRSALEVSRLSVDPAVSHGADLTLYRCSGCDHFQIPDLNARDYYDAFVLTGSHSPKMQRLQREQAERLGALAARKGHFVDVGCGDGSFLSHAAAHFEKVVGIEPSKPYFELAKARGLEVINEYLTENLAFDCPFDAFASRQVFEHLTQPVPMLSLLRRITADDAVGLIEVPNAQKILGEGRYFDLFSDHLNYFTPLSLCRLACRADFEVIAITESFHRDYLELYLRKRKQGVNVGDRREADLLFIREAARRYTRIAAWGAGSKAQAIMTALGGTLALRHVFDNDVHKHGRYLLNCPVRVEPPDREAIGENDLIIIFGVSYQDEILGLLKEMYGYSGDVLCLEGQRPCIAKL
jgi:SAM-dependent methyltransferase